MASNTDTETKIDINELFDKMCFELNPLTPKWCRQLDDTRIDTYYISINPHNYIILSGCGDECDFVGIYKHNNIKYDIMTQQGIEDYANYNDEKNDGMTEPDNIIFELELDDDEFNESMDDLVLLLTKLVKGIVPF
jgi:hypothetical protein